MAASDPSGDLIINSCNAINVNSVKRLHGKVALITASTRGIGFAIAQRLGSEGASLVVSSRKQEHVDEAVKTLRSQLNTHAVIGAACHVSKQDHRKALIQMAVATFGRIDILVSNAAISPSVDPLVRIPEAAMDKLWEVNVKAGILIVQDAVPYMPKGSSIVFISSVAGYNPQKHVAMYGVTKTALFGVTKGFATELAPNVRVNCVAPGVIPTHFASYLTRDPNTMQTIESQTLLGRLGSTSEIASTVAFLVSEDASYITGEVIVVAGGMSSRL